MGVYEDLASDAGYAFGTPENRNFAEMLRYEEMEAEWEYYYALEAEEDRREILFRRFD